jgi:hypothetical protein
MASSSNRSLMDYMPDSVFESVIWCLQAPQLASLCRVSTCVADHPSLFPTIWWYGITDIGMCEISTNDIRQ